MWDDEARLSAAECRDLLDRLLPGGPRGPDVRRELGDEAADVVRAAERLGLGLWDVFSDNNEVLAPDGRCADLGSFRASAGEIADWLNGHRGEPR
jgi:hypothetical protein